MTARLVITFFLIYNVSIVQAKTYYVNCNKGYDANPGTKENPFATIQKAADVMEAGDTCLIRCGTYREEVRVKQSGTSGAPIRFQAYPGELVFITGTELIPAPKRSRGRTRHSDTLSSPSSCLLGP